MGVYSALNVLCYFPLKVLVNSPGPCRGGSLRGYTHKINLDQLAVHINLIPCLTGARIFRQSADAATNS